MNQFRNTLGVVASIAMLLLVVGVAVAQSPVGAPEVGAARIEWRPATNSALDVTVSGPEGFYLRETFAPGESVAFSAFNPDGSLRPEGVYAFEVKASPVLDEQTREDLAAVRDQGDGNALSKSDRLPAPRITSGYFSIVDGAFEMGDKEEAGQVAPGGNRLATKATVLTNGDGVIRNSLCVGFDCPNSPTFSDSTILLMENNTRIKFGDTSNAPFPNNDWEIEANSSLSGGQSYLGFNDCGTADNDGGCATDLVFAVEAGARQNALYVESDGDVGFGTSNPVVNLHAVDGNTPTLRLEQDGSSGFAPQTWDVAGNETNFFIRDVTNGSRLPFRIRPDAPTSSIDIASSGNVGIGTASADAPLHVLRTGSIGTDGQVHIENTNGTAADRNMLRIENNGPPTLFFANNNATSGNWTFTVNNSSQFQLNNAVAAGLEMTLSSSGDMTISGDYFSTTCGTPCAPDYVFEPDYELMPIDELATFVAERKHLPNVPTAGELTGPINMSKLQMRLLEKIEELTLYTLDQQEQIDQKNEELASMKDRLARIEAQLNARTD